ncbi:MrcB family domain-containing protein [Aminivibrio sp.]|jgi:hypothetical protein|uniref:MrcB family domain-containing protein n=1 Tax=Aminivibrio sp. TaxID=1872489 RepID=UPI003D967B6A
MGREIMLREAIEKILKEWLVAKREPIKGNSLAAFIRDEFPEVVRQVLGERSSDYKIRSSPGAGNWADVPWLAILNPKIAANTQEGINPVFLFSADGSGVYLSLNQGTSKPKQILGSRKAKEQIELIKAQSIVKIPRLKGWGLDSIDLKANSPLAKSYEEANIQARFYPADELPSEEILVDDLLSLVDIYSQSEEFLTGLLNDNGGKGTDIISPPVLSPSFKNGGLAIISLHKPFLLLAGISGVGKTRFVREQAKVHNVNLLNYCLVSVRPDWHEPSDLLGYISRIGQQGPRYMATDFLRFLVSAWKDAVDTVSEGQIVWKEIEKMVPFWLCLDEMNLAPVEQYFADYLSVLETREWSEGGYFCDPLLKASVLHQLDETGLNEFWRDVGLQGDGPKEDGLRSFFLSEIEGIPLPPNLIVAGTVNMDETTHSFSRKVIDRALTLDFGEFFPNDFGAFFEPTTTLRTLGIPKITHVRKKDLAVVPADPEGEKTVAFLSSVNQVLEGTPFQLAFRSLNEALSLVLCFLPKGDGELQAVWDDFLMTKVLPRIEGDEDTLAFDGDKSLLTELSEILREELPLIWTDGRKDLLRMEKNGDVLFPVECRSKRKITWMQGRLKKSGFTSFWP